MTEATIPKPRTIFYIDGFNLYRGAIKGTAYKWLDFEALCRELRPSDDIVLIRYFTSLVVGKASQIRQATYLQAIATLGSVRTKTGTFTHKPVKCEVSACTHGSKGYTVLVEKRTDVNIAVHMVADAAMDRCDTLALISGDADLVPALQTIRADYPSKHIAVYVPIHEDANVDERRDRRSDQLRKAAHRGGFLPTRHFKTSQLPEKVIDRNGNTIVKPNTW